MTTLPPESSSQKPRLMQTTCPYCGVGCGVDVVTQGDGNRPLSQLGGTPEHPANFGRLCIKGTHLLDTLGAEKRLLAPRILGKKASWDSAIGIIAQKLTQTLVDYGPEAIGLYGSGQLLTEDYYVANKFMKGFIGSANIDTNSRLCMSSAVAAYKRAFGEDIVPCDYTDLESTDLLIITGSNAAWTHPVLFQRIERAKLKNPALQIVLVDPRKTDTATLADIHIKLKPGTDAALFCGLLRFIAETNASDCAFVNEHTRGFTEALAVAQAWTPDAVADWCDVSLETVTALYTLFSRSPRVVTFFSMGINQSTSGVDKGNAIINCHLASGKIGREGCGPFSITGQPNAMGGREVGGLSNMLAAHMDIDNPQHRDIVASFWEAPALAEKPGLKAVDMFKAAAEGKIKILWIMATNPVASMPNRALVEAALKRCELVIVSDTVAENDTMKFADIALPATGWSEKNGTVTNSERRISRQRGLLPPTGEARHDWEIISAVAREMGFKNAFSYTHPAQIFFEHCQLTARDNQHTRALNLAPLADLSVSQYDNLGPVQWPLAEYHRCGQQRVFSDGRFYTTDAKAQFIAVVPELPAQQTSADYPFILNTGRIRDQWHTMTRTGNAPRLLRHIERPALSMHPSDAEKLGISASELVSLQASCSEDNVLLPVKVDDAQRRGEVFAPIHWSATWGSHAKVGLLLDGAHDPLSGQPELKHGAVKIETAGMATYGVVFGQASQVSALSEHWHYWLKIPGEKGAMMDVADVRSPDEMTASLLRNIDSHLQCTTYQGNEQGTLLLTSDGSPEAVILLSATPVDAPLAWLEEMFAGTTALSAEQLHGLLHHRPDDVFLSGPVVCSCYSIRELPIKNAIREGCDSVSKLGRSLKCGTNCGSCKTELSRLIEAETRAVTTA